MVGPKEAWKGEAWFAAGLRCARIRPRRASRRRELRPAAPRHRGSSSASPRTGATSGREATEGSPRGRAWESGCSGPGDRVVGWRRPGGRGGRGLAANQGARPANRRPAARGGLVSGQVGGHSLLPGLVVKATQVRDVRHSALPLPPHHLHPHHHAANFR